MGIVDFCFINSFSNNNIKNVNYDCIMDSEDYEYLSSNCTNWYSLLAMIESLKKKNDISDISSYIVLNESKKTFTVRVKIDNVINYIEESIILTSAHNNRDDITIIEKISRNVISYLTKIYKDKYKSVNSKKQMFIFNSCAVYPIDNFYLLFSEYYTTTPRLWVRRNTNTDRRNRNRSRKRNNSSPPDYSPTNSSIHKYMAENKNKKSKNDNIGKSKSIQIIVDNKRSIIGSNRLSFNMASSPKKWTKMD